MKILVTGFEPFLKDKLNSSGEVVKSMSPDDIAEHKIYTAILPVSFCKVRDILQSLVEKIEPDALVMLGQAESCKEIKIERVALNLMDALNPDNDGYKPDEEAIVANGTPAYISGLKPKRIVSVLRDKGFDAKISNTAGTYVCNCAYYHAMDINSILSKRMNVIFVHLPLLCEQEKEHPGRCYKTKEEMANAIKLIIETIIKH